MGRKRTFPWRWRLAALLLLVALGGAVWGWWRLQHWAPPVSEYPTQGVVIGASDGPVDFATLRAVGARFVYLDASSGATGRDAGISRNLERVRGSGLAYGAIHAYDPCIPAERQAANFVTTIPRDDGLLPPAIELAVLGDDCPDGGVSEAEVESELTTFLNQVEGHAGKRAMLKISAAFEERYGIANRVERHLWLERNWLQPEYAGRPWTLWTANSALRTEAGPMPLRWVVAQP